MSWEAKVEFEVGHLIRTILDKHSNIIEGVKFEGIEPQYRVDSGRAYLALLLASGKPLLIIECKRRLETAGGYRERRDFEPLSSRVIDQALLYAVRSSSSLFATTNGRIFALFAKPEREAFRIDRHRILVKEIRLTEEDMEEILVTAARWYAGIKVARTPVDWVFIIRLRSFVEWLSPYLIPVIKQEPSRNEEFEKEVGKLRPHLR